VNDHERLALIAGLHAGWSLYDRMSADDRALVDADRYVPVAETRALLEKYRDNFVMPMHLARLETLRQRVEQVA
jgi:hypothetical protein